MFHFIGKFVYLYRWVVIGVIIALMAILGFLGRDLGERLDQGGWSDPNSDWATAHELETSAYGRDARGDFIGLISPRDGATVDDPAFLQAVNTKIDYLLATYPDNIAEIVAYSQSQSPELANKDKTVAMLSISMRGENSAVLKNYQAIQNDLDIPGVTMSRAGQLPIADELDTGMAEDLVRAELIALPVVFILLVLIFGGMIAASMPVITGLLSIIGSLGVLKLISLVTPVNAFAQSIVTLIGLGLAIDYGLFVVSRFREEMAHGYDRPTAVRRTVATAGRTVTFSAVMVAVSLSGLLIFPQGFLKSVAYGAIAAVMLAALLSVTILPAILGLLGPQIDKWSLRKNKVTDNNNSWWGRAARWAMSRPLAVAIPVIAVMLLLFLPLASLSFGGMNERYLPKDNPARISTELFDENFPEKRTYPVKLVFHNADPAVISAVRQRANSIPGLTDTFSFAKSGRAPGGAETSGNDAVVVLQSGLVDPTNASYVIEQLRDIGVPEGSTYVVGGTPALEHDSINALIEGIPLMAAIVLIATTVLMFLAFGSLVLPFKAVLMNLLGLGTTLGLLTWIFVQGNGSQLFQFTPGPLMSPIVVLLMAVIYGLSTDYEVFLVSRMVEARAQGKTTAQAVQVGTAHTGGIITSAAIILVVVCGAFALSDIVMMKYIAFGMIFALILDATVIRLLLVPAIVKLLGEDTWWAPEWMKRIQQKVGLQEYELEAEPVS